MQQIESKVNRLADALLDRARDELDLEAATYLRSLGRLHAVANEMVRAKTHQQSVAAYAEMIDLIKGKTE